MTKPVLLCSASMLAFSMCNAAIAEKSAVPVTHARGEVQRIVSAAAGSVTLYDQNDDDSGIAIISTHFDDFDSFSSYGADDFTIPAGHNWKIREVEVAGAYAAGGGPAASESLFFYKDEKGLPGEQVAGCPNLSGADDRGSFAIKLPRSCKTVLKGGRRYWVAVIANMDFNCCGQWIWETRNGQNGKPAAWENPYDGFGTGCTTWDVMRSCIGDYGEGPDFMFTLKGKDISLQ